jgi:DNA polymerase III delta prime subunit
MAQRLATEYVKTRLTLTEAEMIQFIDMLQSEGSLNVTVDKGSLNGRQVVLKDESGEEVVLRFENRRGAFVSEGSCRVSNARLANLIRKAVSRFKGDAIVNRIYPAFTMKYVYRRGSVVQISEIARGKQKLVYEFKDTAGKLEQLYRLDNVEREIADVYSRIDELLDERNRTEEHDALREVDSRLTRLANKLFELEAF